MVVNFRGKISDYTNAVLGVIKEKYRLKDKSEALDRFAKMYGEEFVEHEMKEEAVKSIIRESQAHCKKYGYRKMTMKELDELSGL